MSANADLAAVMHSPFDLTPIPRHRLPTRFSGKQKADVPLT